MRHIINLALLITIDDLAQAKMLLGGRLQ